MVELIQEIPVEMLSDALHSTGSLSDNEAIAWSQFPHTLDSIHMLQRAGVVHGKCVRVILHAQPKTHA